MIKATIDKKSKLIEFWNEHWYDIFDNNGEKIATLPSVTSVLDKTLSKGYGFNEFLMNNGRESKIIVREAAESGSRIHNAIEKLIKGEVITAEYGDYRDLREWEKLYDFTNWYKELNIKPIATETTVYDINLGVAGTADFICEIDGEIWLLDWKSGNNIYTSAHQQTAAYSVFWNNLNTPKIDKVGIAHIGACTKKKEGMNNKGVKVYPVDVETSYKMFEHTMKLYRYLNPNDKAPTSVFPLELSLDIEL